MCVPTLHRGPLISHKPGFNTHFSTLHPLCRRKSFLTEDALKSIGIWLPQPLAFHNISTLLSLSVFKGALTLGLSLCGYECDSCPQDSILHGPVSLEVLFRQASTCLPGCQPRRYSADWNRPWKREQGRYRCISFQYNVVDFSIICLKLHPFFMLTLEFLSLILCSRTTLSPHNAEKDTHVSFYCVGHTRYEVGICLAWVGAS